MAINNEDYIQLYIHKRWICKHINYKHLCVELFLVKYTSKCSFESAIFFNLPRIFIECNSKLKYYINASVTPSTLNGGSQVILANFVNQNILICFENINLAKLLPSHLYVMVNISIICKCEIESDQEWHMYGIGLAPSVHLLIWHPCISPPTWHSFLFLLSL